ncbi:MAG: 50S ribosomal protein L6, partial [Actinobacteria bacterium]|nr:50S ribosomal protein L6 [Actinomycetota bacterium]
MSRIGKMPVAIPSGVEINLTGQSISVKGPKGTLSHNFPELIKVAKEESSIVITRANDERAAKSLHGMSRTLVANMITGVTQGY